MARYIDADVEVSKYVTVWDCDCSEFGEQTVMAVDDLHYLPTADVVPRADFADQKARADMCAEVIARQDKEIEKLQDKVKRYKRYYFHHDYDKMIVEVLDELDRFINSNCIVIKDERGIKGYVTSGIHFAISDFKKKYTDAEPPKGD
jgi:hypothetical protein